MMRPFRAVNGALELDPRSVQALVWLGLSYTSNAMFQPATEALRQAVELSQATPVAAACLAEAYADQGRRNKRERQLTI